MFRAHPHWRLPTSLTAVFALLFFNPIRAEGPVGEPRDAKGQAAPSGEKPGKATPQPLNPRVLFITAKDSPKCAEELAKLRTPGGEFDKLRALHWMIGAGPENQVQIVDRDEIPEIVKKLRVEKFPTVCCVDNNEIVRSFTSGCTTPLDVWTFGFLAKGIDERPPGAVPEAARVETTGHYRLRGNHWSVDEDWNPSKEKVIGHLRGPAHAGKILASYRIEEWSYEELRSLHDDLHEAEPGWWLNSGGSAAKSVPVNPHSR